MRQIIKSNKQDIRAIWNRILALGKRNKKLLITFVILAVLIFSIVSGLQIYLYLSYLFGNDVFIRLAAQDTVHVEERSPVALEVFGAVTTNPFCDVSCTMLFKDLSQPAMPIVLNTTTESKSFSIAYETVAPAGRGTSWYRAEVKCAATPSTWCSTEGRVVERSVLFTIHHDFHEEQREIIDETGQRLGELTILQELSIEHFAEMVSLFPALALAIDILEVRHAYLLSNISYLETEWNKGHYSTVLNQLPQIEAEKRSFMDELERLEADIYERINEHNQEVHQTNALVQPVMIEHAARFGLGRDVLDTLAILDSHDIDLTISERVQLLRLVRQQIFVLNETVVRVADERREALDVVERALCNVGFCRTMPVETIPELCTAISLARQDARIAHGFHEQFNISFMLNGSYFTVDNSSGMLPEQCAAASRFALPQLQNTTFSPVRKAFSYTTFSAGSVCCIWNCTACCDDCSTNSSLYPVVFIHGHAFSYDTHYEYSLDIFTALQKKLEQEGFLNAGAITLYDQRAEQSSWSTAPVPLTIKGSYYFDTLFQPDSTVLVQTKSENLDTYAVRMKELIDQITYRTDRDKVIIVAHSMGGLVTRRYMQIFGDLQVHKVIFVGTPHQGIEGRIAQLCGFRGARQECRDMTAGSVFLSKLEPQVRRPAYNIIGTGCEMEGEDGDGIVLARNAELQGASTIYVEGNCTGLDVLHTQLLSPSRHPAAYEFIVEAVKGE